MFRQPGSRSPLLAVLVAVVLGACASNGDSQRTLYDDLGGTPGLTRMVEVLIAASVADPEIGEIFVETEIAFLNELLVEQFCELTGGPCTYTGRTMEESHFGLEITEAEFNRFVHLARVSWTRIGVPVGDQNRMLALLAPMRHQVINM